MQQSRRRVCWAVECRELLHSRLSPTPRPENALCTQHHTRRQTDRQTSTERQKRRICRRKRRWSSGVLNELEILARCLIYSYVCGDDIDDRMLTLTEYRTERLCRNAGLRRSLSVFSRFISLMACTSSAIRAAKYNFTVTTHYLLEISGA